MTMLLAELAAKSAVIALLGLAVLAAPQIHIHTRALVARLAFAALLALPVIALWGPQLSLQILPAAGGGAGGGAGVTTIDVAVWVYLAGVCAVATRQMWSLLTLYRWTQAARPLESAAWRIALAEAKARNPRLGGLTIRVSRNVQAPLSWGVPASILIDHDTSRHEERAAAVIAHEASHAERGDWVALMLMQAAATLFWFNPLVWLLQRAARDNAEEIADLAATQSVAPAAYAQVLIDCARAQARGPGAANGMAAPPQQLKRRVTQVLERFAHRSPPNAAVRVAIALGIVAASLPLAALHAAPAGQSAGLRRMIAEEEQRIAAGLLTESEVAAATSDQEARLPEDERRLAIQGRALAVEGRAAAERGRAWANERTGPRL